MVRGHDRWQLRLARAAGGAVYLEESCLQVTAFDAFTGTVDWYVAGPCEGGGGRTIGVSSDGLLWLGDEISPDTIFDLSGNVKGTFVADTLPSFHDGRAFYMHDNQLTAVRTSTGVTDWAYDTDPYLCTSAVIAGRGGQVFVGSGVGNVYELDELTGKQRSMSSAGDAIGCPDQETESMAIAEGRLFVTADHDLVAY